MSSVVLSKLLMMVSSGLSKLAMLNRESVLQIESVGFERNCYLGGREVYERNCRDALWE